MPETVTLELPGTAVEEAEAPPSLTPESAEALAPETDGQIETPESEDTEDPLAAIDDDALAENERVKKLIEETTRSAVARNEESARRKAEQAENDRRLQAEVAEHQNVANGQYLGQFVNIVRAATEDPSWNPDQNTLQQMTRFVGPFAAAGRVQVKEEVRVSLNEVLADVNPNYTVPPARLDEWTRAISASGVGPMAKVAAAIIRDASREADRDAIRQEVEAELLKAQKTDASKTADAAKRGAPRPAGVAGGAPTSGKDWRAQFEDPGSSLAQKREAYEHLTGRKYEG